MPRSCAAFLLVSVTLRQRLQDGGSFHIVETLHALWRGGGVSLDILQNRWQLHFRGQFLNSDRVLPRQNHGVFHRVLQFANVSRPGVVEQFLKGVRRNRQFGFTKLLRELFYKRSHERRNVLLPLAQRGISIWKVFRR